MNHFKKIASVLETHSLDAVLLTCEANRFYASGFHSSGTDGVAIVTRNHNYYFTDSRYTEAAARHVRDAEIRETGREHPYSALINEVIEKEHITRMGYEDEYMTAADFRRFSEKLHCELVPATELLWTLRAVKDQAELECMIQAQRIAEKALADILGEIRPGVTEKEIAALLLYKMLHYGAEDKSFDPIVVSGSNGSLPHGVPSEKPIQAGEFVTMDFGCKFGGYCSDMTRTFYFKEVSEIHRHIYDTVRSANETAISKIKPGVLLCELDKTARDLIDAEGYGPNFNHRLGHFIGLSEHEYGDVSSTNQNRAVPGMIFSIEPGIYLTGDTGVRVEDLVLVTEDGCEVLNHYSKELEIIG